VAESSLSDALRSEVKDFAVLVAWSGPEDKPFYRALLVSASRSNLIEHKPFWGYAVISADELRKLVGVLLSQGRLLVEGRHPVDVAEYYVEADVEGVLHHCPLGFDRDTLRALEGMAMALEPDHRAPIQQIAQRIRPALEQGPS
jgi:hypothetical protein